MFGLIVGILLCGCVGAILGALVMWVIDYFTPYCADSKIVAVAVLIGCITGGFVGVSIESHSYKSFEAQFISSQQTIEQSISAEDLSGFERLELVKQAVYLNSKLAGLQYDSQQWYGFAISDSILDLEPISFKSHD